MYNIDNDGGAYWRGMGGPTSFEDLVVAMEGLIQDGKIRGWGLCNDSAYGLTACTRTARALGMTPPCSIQGDFSMIDRKSEENGVAEAASPYNENVGFMAYNALAGGMLTGKYAALRSPWMTRSEIERCNPSSILAVAWTRADGAVPCTFTRASSLDSLDVDTGANSLSLS